MEVTTMEGFKGLLNQREADQKMPNLKAIEEKIYSDEDYRNKNMELFPQDIKIYIYNIDKLKNHNENTVFEEKIGKKPFVKEPLRC